MLTYSQAQEIAARQIAERQNGLINNAVITDGSGRTFIGNSVEFLAQQRAIAEEAALRAGRVRVGDAWVNQSAPPPDVRAVQVANLLSSSPPMPAPPPPPGGVPPPAYYPPTTFAPNENEPSAESRIASAFRGGPRESSRLTKESWRLNPDARAPKKRRRKKAPKKAPPKRRRK